MTQVKGLYASDAAISLIDAVYEGNVLTQPLMMHILNDDGKIDNSGQLFYIVINTYSKDEFDTILADAKKKGAAYITTAREYDVYECGVSTADELVNRILDSDWNPTIILTNDINLEDLSTSLSDNTLEIANSNYIDLNGHTLNFNGANICLQSGAEVCFEDGSENRVGPDSNAQVIGIGTLRESITDETPEISFTAGKLGIETIDLPNSKIKISNVTCTFDPTDYIDTNNFYAAKEDNDGTECWTATQRISIDTDNTDVIFKQDSAVVDSVILREGNPPLTANDYKVEYCINDEWQRMFPPFPVIIR